MQYEEFLAFVKGRRTIRAIKPDPVPDDVVEKLLEAARWAPTGFNMQPVELLVVDDAGLRAEIRRIVDDYKNADFFALEATREAWQGSPWSIETHGPWRCPEAPVMIAVLGDTRRRVGLPMAARYATQKGDSIFESSLANAFLYLLLAAHSLGLAAQPVSGVKYPSVQGLVKHLLGLPDYIYLVRPRARRLVGDGHPGRRQAHARSRRDGPPRPRGGRRVPERGGTAPADRQAARRQRGAARPGRRRERLSGRGEHRRDICTFFADS